MPNLKKLILDAIYKQHPNMKDLIGIDEAMSMQKVPQTEPCLATHTTYEVQRGDLLVRAIISEKGEIKIEIETIS